MNYTKVTMYFKPTKYKMYFKCTLQQNLQQTKGYFTNKNDALPTKMILYQQK